MTEEIVSHRISVRSFSAECTRYYETLRAYIEAPDGFVTNEGGVVGSTLVYTRFGTAKIEDLFVGDEVLSQTNGFVRIEELVKTAPGGSEEDVIAELPSLDPRSPGSGLMHPMQPTVLKDVHAVSRIFRHSSVVLPALWAGPFLGGRVRMGETQHLYKPILEQPALIWSDERSIPCLAAGQCWEKQSSHASFSEHELKKWICLFGFRIEDFFRATSIERCLSPDWLSFGAD